MLSELYIDNKNVEKLKIPFAIFNKVKINKSEIKYKNKLYDIQKVEIINGIAIVYCINDTQEENLIADFEKFTTEITDFGNTNKQIPKVLSKIIFPEYTFPGNLDLLFNANLIQLISSKYKNNLSNTYLEVISPPPKC
jgi:hypothetical protein